MKISIQGDCMNKQLILTFDDEDDKKLLRYFARLGDHFAGELRKDPNFNYPYLVLERIEEEPACRQQPSPDE